MQRHNSTINKHKQATVKVPLFCALTVEMLLYWLT